MAAGCYSWHTANIEPRAVIDSGHPAVVRVTGNDGTRYVLSQPRVVADTMLGLRGSDSASVALRDVARVEVRRPSPLGTAALVLGIGAVAFVALVWYGMCIADGREGCNVGS